MAYLFLITLSFARILTLQVEQPCSDKLERETLKIKKNSKISEVTKSFLQVHEIDYEVIGSSFYGIYNSPVGEDSFVIVDRKTYRIYGWCYSVDGEIPDVHAENYLLDGTQKKVNWFYAYSENRAGEWGDMCTPAVVSKLNPTCQSE